MLRFSGSGAMVLICGMIACQTAHAANKHDAVPILQEIHENYERLKNHEIEFKTWAVDSQGTTSASYEFRQSVQGDRMLREWSGRWKGYEKGTRCVIHADRVLRKSYDQSGYGDPSGSIRAWEGPFPQTSIPRVNEAPWQWGYPIPRAEPIWEIMLGDVEKVQISEAGEGTSSTLKLGLQTEREDFELVVEKAPPHRVLGFTSEVRKPSLFGEMKIEGNRYNASAFIQADDCWYPRISQCEFRSINPVWDSSYEITWHVEVLSLSKLSEKPEREGFEMKWPPHCRIFDQTITPSRVYLTDTSGTSFPLNLRRSAYAAKLEQFERQPLSLEMAAEYLLKTANEINESDPEQAHGYFELLDRERTITTAETIRALGGTLGALEGEAIPARIKMEMAEETRRNRIESNAGIRIGIVAPPVTAARWLNCEPIEWEKLQGKLVLLDFFAYNCGPCQTFYPVLQKIFAHYGSDRVQVIGVHQSAVDDQKLGEIMTRFQMKYPIAIDRVVESRDAFDWGKTFLDYGVVGMPTIILIGRDGKIIVNENWDEIQARLIEELEGK